METVTISKQEYDRLKSVYALLHDQDFLQKLNRLADLLLAEKWSIVMPEDVTDLSKAAIDGVAEWQTKESPWDNV